MPSLQLFRFSSLSFLFFSFISCGEFELSRYLLLLTVTSLLLFVFVCVCVPFSYSFLVIISLLCEPGL
jgi:hypothetical protein